MGLPLREQCGLAVGCETGPQFGLAVGGLSPEPGQRVLRRRRQGPEGEARGERLADIAPGEEDEAGQKVASGIYLVVLQDGDGNFYKAKVAILH